MERYAFIDVANTKWTASGVLGFRIDWQKLIQLLKGEKWQCRDVFYYEGVMKTDKYNKRTDKLSKMGYTVRSKVIFIHQNEEKLVKFQCQGCQNENSIPLAEAKFFCSKCSLEKPILAGANSHTKANFDVELTVDALDYARPNTEIIILTGDGDFCYLAEKLIERGAVVTFVSSTRRTNENKKRFSTRLRDLIAQEEIRSQSIKENPRIRFLEMNNWKKLIERVPIYQKDQNEKNAAKRDVPE